MSSTPQILVISPSTPTSGRGTGPDPAKPLAGDQAAFAAALWCLLPQVQTPTEPGVAVSGGDARLGSDQQAVGAIEPSGGVCQAASAPMLAAVSIAPGPMLTGDFAQHVRPGGAAAGSTPARIRRASALIDQALAEGREVARSAAAPEPDATQLAAAGRLPQVARAGLLSPSAQPQVIVELVAPPSSPSGQAGAGGPALLTAAERAAPQVIHGPTATPPEAAANTPSAWVIARPVPAYKAPVAPAAAFVPSPQIAVGQVSIPKQAEPAPLVTPAVIQPISGPEPFEPKVPSAAVPVAPTQEATLVVRTHAATATIADPQPPAIAGTDPEPASPLGQSTTPTLPGSPDVGGVAMPREPSGDTSSTRLEPVSKPTVGQASSLPMPLTRGLKWLLAPPSSLVQSSGADAPTVTSVTAADGATGNHADSLAPDAGMLPGPAGGRASGSSPGHDVLPAAGVTRQAAEELSLRAEPVAQPVTAEADDHARAQSPVSAAAAATPRAPGQRPEGAQVTAPQMAAAPQAGDAASAPAPAAPDPAQPVQSLGAAQTMAEPAPGNGKTVGLIALGDPAGGDAAGDPPAAMRRQPAPEDARPAHANRGGDAAQAAPVASASAIQPDAAGLTTTHPPETSPAQVRQVRLPDLQLTRGAELHGHRLRLAIDPPELGGCKLELTLRGDQVRATVIAERADTLAALRDAEPQIRQALAQRGIELAGYDVGGDFGRGRQEPGAMPRQWTGLTQTSGARPGGLAGDTVRLLGRAHAGRIDLVA